MNYPARANGGLNTHFEPGAVNNILRAVREHLGMEVAFASRVNRGKVVIQYADSGASALLEVGDIFEAEEGYCQRIIDGRLPFLIPDTSKNAEAARLECTRTMPIGAHLSVPLRLSDGSVHGTFCCFKRSSDPSLNRRDLQTLQAFAELAAAQIEAEQSFSEARIAISERIRDLVESDTLKTLFQPIQRLSDGAVIGVEALSRFPDHDSRSPRDWFAEADQVGLGGPLELAAIRSAIAHIPCFPEDIYVAVNVSPGRLSDPEFLSELTDLPSRRLVIELTEHSIVEDYEGLAQILDKHRAKLRVAIDDVGAGYSGLRHILDLKPDILKLDLSLSRQIDQDPARRALASALVTFAKAIGCVIVAEGVERFGEYAVLRELGVDAVQGFLVQPPLEPELAAEFIQGRRAALEAG